MISSEISGEQSMNVEFRLRAKQVSKLLVGEITGIRRIVLFGSSVNGVVDDCSDIDIVIEAGDSFNDILVVSGKVYDVLSSHGLKAVSHLENYSGSWAKVVHYGVYQDEAGFPFNVGREGLTLYLNG